jgi:predicted secreted protein
MTAIAGKVGKVVISSSTFVAEIKNWKVNAKAGTADVTPFNTGNDAAWKAFVATLKEWSGSFEGNLDLTDTNGQYALFNTYLGGSSLTVKLYIDGTKYLSGSAIITGVDMAADVGDAETVTFTFQGTGGLTYN